MKQEVSSFFPRQITVQDELPLGKLYRITVRNAIYHETTFSIRFIDKVENFATFRHNFLTRDGFSFQEHESSFLVIKQHYYVPANQCRSL